MSRKGMGYVAANGSPIKNFGEKKIVGYTKEGEGIAMKIQCTDVQKALGSVHKMNMGGNVVALDSEKSYMQNKKTGQKMRIEYEGGQYVMYLWVPSTKEIVKNETEKNLKGNRYAVLAVGDEGEGDFSRRARLP